MKSSLGDASRITFQGAVDNAISQRVADRLSAELREALTNVGKHAEATSYIVTIRVAEDVSLEVHDNGIGIELPPALGAGLGLVNLRSRGEIPAGSFGILTGDDETRPMVMVSATVPHSVLDSGLCRRHSEESYGECSWLSSSTTA